MGVDIEKEIDEIGQIKRLRKQSENEVNLRRIEARMGTVAEDG
jgi:hypothetical protein